MVYNVFYNRGPETAQVRLYKELIESFGSISDFQFFIECKLSDLSSKTKGFEPLER